MVYTKQWKGTDMTNTAFGIIDADRCFFEESEGKRLNLPGFGELGVPGSATIIPALNSMTETAKNAGLFIFSTNEAHPEVTAHFSDTPNFVDSWPKHGRDGTPGALPHPELLIAQQPELASKFIKGDVVARTTEEDTSYTGALAHRRGSLELLPDELRRRGIRTVYLGGLAIGSEEHPLCVDSTAIDFAKQGFEVTVLTDAVEAVIPENRAKSFKNMGRFNIHLVTTEEARAEVEAARRI